MCGVAQSAAAAYQVLHTHQAQRALPKSGVIADGSGNLYGTTLLGGSKNLGYVYRVHEDGTGFTVLHSFDEGTYGWGYGSSTLALDDAGFLYGTRSSGGAADLGTVYKISVNGDQFTVLHEFAGGVADGARPLRSSLLVDHGELYGTTSDGGEFSGGTIFRVRTDGSHFKVLWSLDGGTSEPRFVSSLVMDRAHNLYGTMSYGGTVFTLRTNGTGYKALHHFAGGASDGEWAGTPLLLDGEGSLFGTTLGGGASGFGTVFTMRTDGSGFTLVHSFSGTDGMSPNAGLSMDSSGDLYGTTVNGGRSGAGTAFRLRANGTDFAVLHSFADDAADGLYPESAPVIENGTIYGTATNGGRSRNGIVFKLLTDGSGYQIVEDFPTSDGSRPLGGLVLDAAGTLYGTTAGGGTFQYGSVFAVGRDGSGFRLLHSFDPGSFDGWAPAASLLLDASGMLFGTTSLGGDSNLGTVFAIRSDGTDYRLLHSFSGRADGSHPAASLVIAPSGILYGTTEDGGLSDAGTVFTMQRDGSGFAVLHAFDPASSAYFPQSSLVLGGDGSLYGTTPHTVYSLRADGSGFRVLHRFSSLSTDADWVYSPLVLDGAGVLYGTSFGGGDFSGHGTVFSVKTDGTAYRILRRFGGIDDTAFPVGGVSLDGFGNLYGTGRGGVIYSQVSPAAVFRMKTDGTSYTLLHHFGGGSTDGDFPHGSLVLDESGYLYGTTVYGGPYDEGVEFRLAAFPGDADGDRRVTISDVFYLINHLFASGAAPYAGGDANGDGAITVADVFYLINYLFGGGPAPS